MNDCVHVPAAEAIRYLSGSLEAGREFSGLESQRVREVREGILFSGAPHRDDSGRIILDNTGARTSFSRAKGSLNAFVADFCSGRRVMLVVEDDLGTVGDPGVERDSGYVGEAVIRWADLATPGLDASDFIMAASSGHPSNSFLVSGDAADYSLRIGAEVRSESLTRMVRSTLAIVSSLYDVEAFLVGVL